MFIHIHCHSYLLTSPGSQSKMANRRKALKSLDFQCFSFLPKFRLAQNAGQRIFPVGSRRCQEYSAASLNMKNLMSPTPRNWVLNAFILALKDSAEALVSLRSK